MSDHDSSELHELSRLERRLGRLLPQPRQYPPGDRVDWFFDVVPPSLFDGHDLAAQGGGTDG